ncbi:MAG: DNA-binding domain-containing protein [Alteromonadaceae bacterium]
MSELCSHDPVNNDAPKNLQQRLLEVIWNDESSIERLYNFDVQGINIYRRNLLANAQRALTISFPTVFELLDSDISENLAAQFIRCSPPNHGDWAQWGENFPHFLKATEEGDNYPYIIDCATLDWYVHCALKGSDQTLIQTSLQLLSEREPDDIFIEFNQNVKVLKTTYPLNDIFEAHHHKEALHRQLAMAAAKASLSVKDFEQILMIYRPEFQPKITILTVSEGTFMNDLLAGESLEKALNAVKNDNDFSFEQWLLNAITYNLIHYFKEK